MNNDEQDQVDTLTSGKTVKEGEGGCQTEATGAAGEDSAVKSYPLAPAGFVPRLFALLIDWSIIAGLREAFSPVPFASKKYYQSIYRLLAEIRPEAKTVPGQIDFLSYLLGSILLFWAVGLLYNSLFEASRFRGSPGKLFFGIYVGSLSGEQCSFRQAFARNLWKVLSWLFCLGGFLMALFGKRKQALHDFQSDTLVFRYLTGPQQANFPAMVFAVFLFFIIEGAIYSSIIRSNAAAGESAAGKAVDIRSRAGSLKKNKEIIPPEKTAERVVPATPAPTPTIPFKSYPGILEWGEKKLALRGVYVRFRDAVRDLEEYGVFRESPRVKILEAFLFSQQLSNDEEKTLERLPDIIGGSVEKIGKAPLVHLQFVFPQLSKDCSPADVYSSKLTFYNSDGALEEVLLAKSREVVFEALPLSASGILGLSCLSLKQGAAFEFSYSAENELAGYQAPKLSWHFNLSAKIKHFKPFEGVIIDQYKDVLALWNPHSGVLELGFFSSVVGPVAGEAYKAKRTLSGAGGKRPFLIAVIPLIPRVQRPNRDMVKRGFTLTFYTDPLAGINLPPGVESVEYRAEAGEVPKGLSGLFKEGSRLFGRLEGEWFKSYDLDAYQIGWELSFSAPVFVVE